VARRRRSVAAREPEAPMITARRTSSHVVALLTVALATSAWTAARAQSTAGIADKDSIFIDGKTFQIVPGKAHDDFAKRVEGMGAREIGPGAIIFRSGDKLYIAGAPIDMPALEPQKGPILITYEPIKNPEHQKIYEMVKERRTLETIKLLLSPFRIPVDLNIKTVGCDGVANAWFDQDGKNRTIRICYEYLKEVMDKLPKETTPEGIEPHEALIGQLLFAVLHETGHAMFNIFEVPIFGHQEDAADQFATYIMLQFGGERAHRLIRGAAYSYKGFIKDLKDKPQVTMPLAAFSSDHGQPEERFYNLACTAYGYDPKIFAAMVEKDYLPQSRAKKCKFEYEDITYAMSQVIGPHVDKERAKKVLATVWTLEKMTEGTKAQDTKAKDTKAQDNSATPSTPK
jgi:Putative metallopeptidase